MRISHPHRNTPPPIDWPFVPCKTPPPKYNSCSDSKSNNTYKKPSTTKSSNGPKNTTKSSNKTSTPFKSLLPELKKTSTNANSKKNSRKDRNKLSYWLKRNCSGPKFSYCSKRVSATRPNRFWTMPWKLGPSWKWTWKIHLKRKSPPLNKNWSPSSKLIAKSASPPKAIKKSIKSSIAMAATLVFIKFATVSQKLMPTKFWLWKNFIAMFAHIIFKPNQY